MAHYMPHRTLNSRGGWIVLLALAACAAAGEPEPAATQPYIARFAGDKPAAISFTIDDGFKLATDELAKALEPTGFKVTWFINPGHTTEDMRGFKGRAMWPQWRALHKAGHEIGNHGLLHRSLTGLDEAEARREIDEAHALIEKQLGVAPFSYCFANGQRNEAVDKLVAVKHRAHTRGRLFYGGDKWTLDKANRWVDGAIANKEWIVPMLHSYSKGYAQFGTPGEFDLHLQYVKDHEAQLWVAPFGTVSKYVQLRDASKLESKPLDGGVELRLTAEKDTAVFDQLLTVVVPAPGAARVEARRAGQELPARVDAGRVLVELRPGPEPCTVTWSN
ncbi:MAG: polysaccharide deacetylase family protein [Planctomycetota bacterium]|nr:polysaccharide deacetylase family protein [Planctomycetota bacterium]